MNLRDLVDPAELQRVLAEHSNPDEATDALLRRIMQSNPEGFVAWLDHLKETRPEEHAKLIAKLNAPATLLELSGYENWLRNLGPRTFTGEFGWFHHDLWQWYWPITNQLRRGQKVDTEDTTYIAPWGRGMGKSSNAEWLAIAEGCLVGTGFVLYVCGAAEQAESHVEAIRERLEAEAKLRDTYPGMAKPSGKGGYLGEHRQYGWRQDYLMTANGWAIRPVGLDKAIRGLKRGDTRVTLIILDDIDDDDDSIDVILKKERRLAKKILPTGTARTKVVYAQNLIHSNSVLNRIHTRITDMLALRRGDIAVKAFDDIQIEFRQTERGPRNLIVGGKPVWPAIDMAECQAFLDRSGLDAFNAEYQHDFSAEETERVLPEYDDRVKRAHVITWSQYLAKYYRDRDNPPKRVPAYWPCALGIDIGFTPEHLTASTWITRAPENAPLTGSIFRYRGKTFSGVSINRIGVALKMAMWPAREPFYKGEFAQIIQQLSSHEKKGERLILNGEMGFAFQPCDKEKMSGISQWRHYLQIDKKKPHPFHEDKKLEDGTWDIGCPAWFDIVDDDQFDAPRDDRGLRTHRDQAYTWKYKKIKVTESGVTTEQPMKIADDTNDSTRMLIVAMGPPVIEKTREERIVDHIPLAYRWENLRKRTDLDEAQKEMSFNYVRARAEKIVGGKYDAPPTDPFGQVLEEIT